jgi:hypothetical protein
MVDSLFILERFMCPPLLLPLIRSLLTSSSHQQFFSFLFHVALICLVVLYSGTVF